MKKLKYSAENSPQAWLFLLPALLIIIVFNVIPLIQTFIISFQKGTLNSLEFNGLKNYLVVLQDPKFHTALFNTSIYAVVVVPLALIISMFIAVILVEKIKFKYFALIIFNYFTSFYCLHEMMNINTWFYGMGKVSRSALMQTLSTLPYPVPTVCTPHPK